MANRFAILLMEGWDGTTDGRPTDLVRRRWGRFGTSGCGLVWGEATAVRPDGRANSNQLVIGAETVDDLAGLRGLLDPDQMVGLQLTHSGRFARPEAAPAPAPHAHPELDGRAGSGPADVFGDDELDELAEQYVEAAVLAQQAGFDFVDVKHCHGYLLHELLSAYDRPGRYGGDLAGRTAFLQTVVAGIRSRPSWRSPCGCRPSICGPLRRRPTGRPRLVGGLRARLLGGDGTGLGIDLTEAHELLSVLEGLGIGLVGVTAGSPYYNPHVQRPAYFPRPTGTSRPRTRSSASPASSRPPPS